MSTIRVKRRAESNASRCKRYREMKKGEDYLEAARERAREYRQNQTDEQRMRSNELARLRMKKMRAKRREEAAGKASAKSKETDGKTMSNWEKKENRRIYNRLKQQQHRASMNPTKKRWVQQKDRERGNGLLMP